MRIEILGAYPVENSPEPCHLLELLVTSYTGPLTLSDFAQEQAGRPRSEWQVPWDEHVLTAGGSSPRRPFEAVLAVSEQIRLAFFFHYLQFGVPLLSPAGLLLVPAPTPRPDRLASIAYEPPC